MGSLRRVVYRGRRHGMGEPGALSFSVSCSALTPIFKGLAGNLELFFQFSGRRPRLKSLAYLSLNLLGIFAGEANSSDAVFEASYLPETFPSACFVPTDAQIGCGGFVAAAVLEDLQREFFNSDFGEIVGMNFQGVIYRSLG